MMASRIMAASDPRQARSPTMLAYEVKDMTCGHCVSTITKAVKDADRDAKLTFDLTTHRVEVEPAAADASEIEEAIRDAGYTPVPA
jgi:copper chaperone